jgi:hypothetical protein
MFGAKKVEERDQVALSNVIAYGVAAVVKGDKIYRMKFGGGHNVIHEVIPVPPGPLASFDPAGLVAITTSGDVLAWTNEKHEWRTIGNVFKPAKVRAVA